MCCSCKASILIVLLSIVSFWIFSFLSGDPDYGDHSVYSVIAPMNKDPVDKLLDYLTPFFKWAAKISVDSSLEANYTVKGINDPVEILIDNYGVPHIYAENEVDLYFGLGFYVATQRLWQIELSKRLSQGRLSEIFGSMAFGTDKILRTFGFHRVSKEAEFPDDVYIKYAKAYADGINEFINSPSMRLPLEFQLLGIKPENITFTDVAAFGTFTSFQMGKGWAYEIARSYVMDILGNDIEELEVAYPELSPTILKDVWEFNLIDKEAEFDTDKDFFVGSYAGSNSYVVSGEHTSSGKPILCNDPHLPLKTPSFWMEVHLHSPNVQIYGVTIPLVPVVAVGHNQNIAFGITLNIADGSDLILEQFTEFDKYEFKGDTLTARVVNEEIKVKGEDSVVVPVRITRNGPVISDSFKFQKPVAFRNTLLETPFKSLFFSHAQNWEEFVDHVQLFPPGLNFVYADVKGNIGYRSTGKLPLRTGYDGIFPVPGWTGEYEWDGFVPYEKMPFSFNPKAGFIVTANNKIADADDYPYYISHFYDAGYRARRITELITGKMSKQEKLTFEFLQSIQTDVKSLACVEYLAALKQYESQVLETLNSDDAQIFKDLLKFDCEMTVESTFATVYNVMKTFMIRDVFDELLGEDIGMQATGKGLHPVLLAQNEWYYHDINIITVMLNNENSKIMKTVGGQIKVISEAITNACNWTRREFGDDQSEWNWGKIHTLTMDHSLGQVRPLDRVFNVGPIPTSGDKETAKLGGYPSYNPYHVQGWGSHYRQCFDLGDWSKGESIHIPGQSGNIDSPHYDDFIEEWSLGNSHPAYFDRESVLKDLESQVTLYPEN